VWQQGLSGLVALSTLPRGAFAFMAGILPSGPRIAHLTFRSPSVSLHGPGRGPVKAGEAACLALTGWPGLYPGRRGERVYLHHVPPP
jgi:hypothetical protein